MLYGRRAYGGRLSCIATPQQLEANPSARPVPAWLRRIVERGVALDPADRFPAMTDVVLALEAGTKRRSVGVVWIAAGVTIALADTRNPYFSDLIPSARLTHTLALSQRYSTRGDNAVRRRPPAR